MFKEIIKNHKRVLFFILTVLFLVHFLIFSNRNVAQDVKEEVVSIREGDHVYGNHEAIVTIIEYAEAECIYCKQLHPILQRIVSEHTNEVSLVYRHFPLPMHPKSFTEAMALECVAELGGNELFWEFLTELFNITPSNNDIDISVLPSLAVQVGIDRVSFDECLASERHKDKIQHDIETGFSLNVDSVPQLFVRAPNGEIFVLTKTPNYRTLKATIEAALSARE